MLPILLIFWQFVVHFLDVEFLRIITAAQPTFDGRILRVFFIFQDPEVVVEARDAHAVFRRAGELAVGAEGVDHTLLFLRDLFHLDGVLPVVAEVVEVGERETLLHQEQVQDYLPGVRDVLETFFRLDIADLVIVDVEFEKVGILPAHGYLKDVVKVKEVHRCRHHHPAPDGGVGVVEGDFEGEELGHG